MKITDTQKQGELIVHAAELIDRGGFLMKYRE
jgi:hypothetical protein